MIHLIYGTDEYSVREKYRAIKEGLGDVESLSNNTTILDGAKITSEELCNHVQAMPFLGMHRLVVVEGLVQKLETNKPRSTKKDTPSNAELFNEVLKNSVCPTTEVVLIEGDLSPKSGKAAFDPSKIALLKDLPNLQIYACNVLSGAKLVQWINHYVADNNARISNDAVGLLIQNLGGDLWAMKGNVDKLISYASGREISKKDVELMVPELGNEKDIWDLLDAALGRNLPLAMKLYLRLQDNGQDPYYILVMLVFQLRKVIRCKNYMVEGVSEAGLPSALGVSPWQINSALLQAKKFSHDELMNYYRSFLDADVSMKTGKMDPDTAVTLLISELCVGKQ